MEMHTHPPASSSSSTVFVSADAFLGTEVEVESPAGPVTVAVSGRKECPALITLHDVGLCHRTCYLGLAMCASPHSLLHKGFCTYHINVPGHLADPCTEGAMSSRKSWNRGNATSTATSDRDTILESGALLRGSGPKCRHKNLSTQILVDVVLAVMKAFVIKEAVFMGVGYGGQVLARLATQRPRAALALILISPSCGPAGLLEQSVGEFWIQSLRIRGVTNGFVSYMMSRSFSYHGRRSYDLANTFANELKSRDKKDLAAYLAAYIRREDLSYRLKRVDCPVLILCGDQSPLLKESLKMSSAIPCRDGTTFIQLDKRGLLVSEEQPVDLLSPIELFLQGLVSNGVRPTSRSLST